MNGTGPLGTVPVLLENGTALSSREVGERFADFYGGQQDCEEPTCFDLFPSPNDDSNVTDVFSPEELSEVLLGLGSTAPGPDGISPSFLRHLPARARVYLLSLFNDSWVLGSIPEAWRTGIIVPISKVGSGGTAVENFRPITLLSAVGKTLERLVLARLNWWMAVHRAWGPTQHGGVQGRSVFSAMTCLTNAIAEAEQSGRRLAVEFLDVQRAYDSLDRRSILKELVYLGLPYRLTRWIQAFLKERLGRVRVGNILSGQFKVHKGVTQGSPLSPALYNMGTNDFSRVCTSPFRTQFIDDLAVGHYGSSGRSALRSIQTANYNLVEWGASHGLAFGSAKSVILLFGGGINDQDLPAVFLDGKEVPQASWTRFLGIRIDDRLSWGHHVAYLKKELIHRGRLLRVLGHYQWGASYSTLRAIYLACVQPILDFGALFYGAATRSTLRSLDVEVRKLLRIVTGLPSSTASEALYVESCTDPPDLRRERQAVGCALGIEAAGEPIEDWIARFRGAKRGARKVWHTLSSYPSWHEMSDHRSWRATVEGKAPWTRQKVDIQEGDTYYKGDPGGDNALRLKRWLVSIGEPLEIYTDASVAVDGHVAAGFQVPATEEGNVVELPRGTAITSAEIWAISMAVEWTLSQNKIYPSVVVLSDSLGAISHLSSTYRTFYSSPATRLSIAVSALQLRGCSLSLTWLPSHSGFPGNDLIDSTVSTVRPLPFSTPAFPPRTSRGVLASSLRAVHRRRWRSSSTSLTRVRPSLSVPCRFSWNSRIWEVTLARARVNRLPVGANRFRWGQAGTDLCQACKIPDTIAHRLLVCPSAAALRLTFSELTGVQESALLAIMLGIGSRVERIPSHLYHGVCGVLRAT